MSLLDGVLPGTWWQWVLLPALLPLVGYGTARTWGPRVALAAQRGLLVLLAYLVGALALAAPVHAVPFLLAALPVAGAAASSRARPQLASDPVAWVLAALAATPAILLSHLGPYEAAPVGFVLALAALAVKSVLDPVWPPGPRARAWWAARGTEMALAAQRALLVLLAYLALALAFAWPVHATLFALAAAPVVALALTRRNPTILGEARAWGRALLLAGPAVALSALGI